MIDKELKLEELWDFIAGSIGFDRKGKKIQNAIREFIKLRETKIPFKGKIK